MKSTIFVKHSIEFTVQSSDRKKEISVKEKLVLFAIGHPLLILIFVNVHTETAKGISHNFSTELLQYVQIISPSSVDRPLLESPSK
jgi:hypothetical protein